MKFIVFNYIKDCKPLSQAKEELLTFTDGRKPERQWVIEVNSVKQLTNLVDEIMDSIKIDEYKNTYDGIDYCIKIEDSY